MSKVYTVDFWYTQYGTAMHIEADNQEEAEKWLMVELSQNGMDDIEVKINEHDYGVQDAEEVSE